ncbi:nuclear transport factor 2 family protein [Microbacterium sp. NPDC016588]|jgi:hypothetical protein|uniref:nuclear transport factor 2 family protein n=1 Tax=Microbacterium sp. TaxID=51671 RepID=UPI0025E3E648|nr:nuclear transport factor 2 family protein [Microbacterium sp.]MBQ9918250.1 nuclear transport factor 2 family protein [Microbacterium sp.]
MTSVSVPLVVQRAVDAINAGDTDMFVEAFSADGLIDDWGRVLQGHAGVREWARTDAIGAGARMQILDAVTTGAVTEIRFSWRSRVFTGESTAIVTAVGDRIGSFRIPPHA